MTPERIAELRELAYDRDVIECLNEIERLQAEKHEAREAAIRLWNLVKGSGVNDMPEFRRIRIIQETSHPWLKDS